MNRIHEDVTLFCRIAGQPTPASPAVPSPKIRALRTDLIWEEFSEFVTAQSRAALAHKEGDEDGLSEALSEVADAIADMLYVVVGAGVAWGLPMPAVYEEVHRSNILKFSSGCIKDENGKVVKPPGWKPPDVQGIIRSAMLGVDCRRERELTDGLASEYGVRVSGRKYKSSTIPYHYGESG